VSNVVSLRAYAGGIAQPTLVLVDLQREHIAESRGLATPQTIEALANCRAALAHARSCGFPIAFVRRSNRAPLSNSPVPNSRWLEGFEPKRTDMVFERNRPSCYASPAFADVMANETASFVLAGLGAETACLATALEAFHRGQQFTFLADASVSRALDDISADQVHRTIEKVVGTYGEVIKTRTWIAASSYGRRSRGIRK
jgi:nicotinamidase-related amidase